MNTGNELKVIEWGMMTAVQKLDIDFLDSMIKCYESSLANFELNKSYIALVNQQFKLNALNKKEEDKAKKAADKALEKMLRNDDKVIQQKTAEIMKIQTIEERKEQKIEKITAMQEQMDEMIDKYCLYQMGVGKLYWYIKENDGKFYTVQPDALKARFPVINEYIPQEAGLPAYDSYKDFLKRMVERDRLIHTVSEDWTTVTGNGVLNKLERRFMTPNEEGKSDYHWMIDAVFESVCGDEEGAIESFELSILSKYLHPYLTTNPHSFFNDEGSTGKTFLVSKFLAPLFGGQINQNASIETITGKFNSESVGNAIVFVNETLKENHDAERLKAMLGSPTITVEHKFERPYQTPNTAMLIGSSNANTGAVLLSGTGSDRRFSIYSSKTSLASVVLKYLVKHGVKDLDGELFTLNFDKTYLDRKVTMWIKKVGDPLLHDKESISKWIVAMVEKHGDVDHVEAFHSVAYDALLTRQRSAWLDQVQKIFEDPNFTMIRNPILLDWIKECNPNEKMHKKAIKDKIEKLIRDLGLDIEYDGRFNCVCSGKVTSATVWKRKFLVGGKFTLATDSEFGHFNNYDKWIWDIVE